MTILAVDCNVQRLDSLEALLKREFPSEIVIRENDSLAAGQYAFNHPVDILFAALEMPRLDGLKLTSFARYTNPDAMVFLMVEPGDDFETALWMDEVDGLLYYPVSSAPLLNALQFARSKRNGQASS